MGCRKVIKRINHSLVYGGTYAASPIIKEMPLTCTVSKASSPGSRGKSFLYELNAAGGSWKWDSAGCVW